MKPQTKSTKRREKKQITLELPEKPAPVVPSPPVEPDPCAASPVKTKTDHAEVAARIADQLGETKAWPRGQIKQIVWALGARQATVLAQRAQDIEAADGMLVNSGKRKRTVGGILFHLAYTEGKPQEGKTLPRPIWKARQAKATPEG